MTVADIAAVAVQRKVSALRHGKGSGVQRKLHRCYVFSGTGRNRKVRGEQLFSWMVLRREEWRKGVLTLDLGQTSKGHLVKKVCMRRLRRVGARLAAGELTQGSLTEKIYVNTK